LPRPIEPPSLFHLIEIKEEKLAQIYGSQFLEGRFQWRFVL